MMDPPPAREHRGDLMDASQEGRMQVHRNRGLPVGERDNGKRCDRTGGAGVVKCDIQAAKCVYRFCHQSLMGLGLTDVARDDTRLSTFCPDARCNLFKRGFAPGI